MAQGNGATAPQGQQQGQGQGQGNQGFVARAVGDISQWFKPKAELDARDAPPATQQQGQQGSQGQQGQQSQQGQPPSGATSTGATNDPNSVQNPLDVYAKMFDNGPRVDKDGKPLPDQTPRFKLESKVIKDAASKIDPFQGLPQELADKLQSGEPLDTQTTLSLMRHATQSAYAAAMEHQSTLTDRFVDMRLGHERQGLGGEVNRILARTHATSDPAISSNPVLREHFSYVSDRIAQQYPDATPDWIAQQAKKYFTDMAAAVSPQSKQGQGQQQGQSKPGEELQFDWQGYITQPKQ